MAKGSPQPRSGGSSAAALGVVHAHAALRQQAPRAGVHVAACVFASQALKSVPLHNSSRAWSAFQLFQLGFIKGQVLQLVLAEVGTHLQPDQHEVLARLAGSNMYGRNAADTKLLVRIMSDVWRQMSPAQKLPFVSMAGQSLVQHEQNSPLHQ